MLDFVYTLPSHMVLAIVVLGLSAVTAAGPFVMTTLRRHPVSKTSHDTCLDGMKLVGSLIAVFAAFMLVLSVNRLDAANQSVSAEAANMLQLDRALARVDTPESLASRQALRAYVQALVTTGWAAVRQGTFDPQTEHRFEELITRVQPVEPPSNGTNFQSANAVQRIHEAMDELEDSRSARMAAAHSGLPGLFWLVLVGLVAIFCGLSAMTWPKAQEVIPRVCYMMAISLMLSLLVLYDHPFQGEQSASIDPFMRTLAKLERTPVGVTADRIAR